MKPALLPTVGLLVMTACSPTSVPGAGSTLASNIAYDCSSAGSQPAYCEALYPDAAHPEVKIDGDIAYVSFYPRMDANDAASEACNEIIAIAHDPNTAASLGINSVVILANGDTPAQCFAH